MCWRTTVAVSATLAFAAGNAPALVNLEWRPQVSAVSAGEPVTIGLYALSDSPVTHTVSAMDVVILWDADRLGPPALGAKQPWWLTDGFFQASPGGINTVVEDGDAMYTAWANFGSPVQITDAGLLCVRMTFTARTPTGAAQVHIVPSFGEYSVTRVFDGSSPNTDIKGTLGTAQVIVFPAEALSSVAAAKQLPDHSLVKLSGPVVTRCFGSIACFYVEDVDRSAGIRVNCAPELLPGEGDTPVILGTIRTVNGERVIEAASTSDGGSVADLPAPLGVTPARIATGLTPQGLLLRCWGLATSDGADGVLLNDGSGQALRIELHGVQAPRTGRYIAVAGVLGADAQGPVLRVSNPEDIVLYAEQ